MNLTDNELLKRAVLNARSRSSRGFTPRWVCVMECFSLGSTFSIELCERFELDPDEKVRVRKSS